MTTRPFITLTLGLCLAAVGCDRPGPKAGDAQEWTPLTVSVASVELEPQARRLTLAGVIKPAKRAILSTRMSGEIKTLAVQAGDEVQADRLLVEVDARDLLAGVEAARQQEIAARAALGKSRKDAERLQRLYDQDLIALARLEQAQLLETQRSGELARAQAELRARLVDVDYARIRAPFDGIVSEVLVDEGSFVGPGTGLLVLEARGALEADASVSQSVARHLHPGDDLTVMLPDGGARAQGRLQAVIPALEGGGAGRRLRVTIEDVEAGFQPGQVVEIILPAGGDARTRTRVPAEAIVRRGQLVGVFVVVDSPEGPRAALRWLDPLEDPGEERAGVTFEQGLTAGERVIVGAALERLRDGQQVRIEQ